MVTDGSVHRDWDALGCAAVIDHRLELGPLLDVLTRHTLAVDRSRRPGRTSIRRDPGARRGRLLAVLGRGGAGTSTVAMAAGTGLRLPGRCPQRRRSSTARDVVTLAMYHHIGDVIPGLPELVEAHRSDRLDPAAIRRPDLSTCRHAGTRCCSDVVGRRTGSRCGAEPSDAAIDGLVRAFDSW